MLNRQDGKTHQQEKALKSYMGEGNLKVSNAKIFYCYRNQNRPNNNLFASVAVANQLDYFTEPYVYPQVVFVSHLK